MCLPKNIPLVDREDEDESQLFRAKSINCFFSALSSFLTSSVPVTQGKRSMIPISLPTHVVYSLKLVRLFVEQVYLLLRKNISQKQRNGRQFWKDSVMIQFFICVFVTNIISSNSRLSPSADVYSYFKLPPLSSAKPWGIFNQDSKGNTIETIISKRLYYSPNNHPGVLDLIDSLVSTYPEIEAVGALNNDGINDLYKQNLFNSWASVQFSLNDDQVETGQLITSESTPSVVNYQIAIAPVNYGSPLPTFNYTDSVYNDQSSDADIFWSSGYLTLQNFIATYLAKNYSFVDPNFNVDTFVQRYPKSPIYKDTITFSIDKLRNEIWKWIGGTILSVCLFIPMLSLLTEIVRERQYLMKDLLEISGMMNISYYSSYLLMAFILGEFSCLFTIGVLRIFGIVNEDRVTPYLQLLTIYVVASASFGMAFGFVIPRSEFYGLPAFLLNTALTVCGAYLAVAYNISIGLKLFCCFLSPSVGLSMGIVVIENYLYVNGGPMNYRFINHNKNYPNLNDINSILLVSALTYVLITLCFPLETIWNFFKLPTSEGIAINKLDHVKYPCDVEENTEVGIGGKVLLNVSSLTQVYPDGTNAVSDMSFKVTQGEVLSFLGANGAGKSTTMKMLCGTINATYGDATVNGFSITSERTLARRNLGIAMQQDVLWDDVNVEDHLLLFGRLRGLHGKKLHDSVAQMCESVGFPEKKKSLAGTLSGGQKRRLCVALSMVGDNPVVYLDEPTAGLDPVSRRQLWELIKKNRGNRAILLTTHFMDEADALGDRIAIVKEGRLRALGTSKYLKHRFGLGYLIRMSLTDKAVPHQINQFIQKSIPKASISSSAGTELVIRLPQDDLSLFPSVFEQLEIQSEKIGIRTYGIETTTLEEVFMRIVNEDNEQLFKDLEAANHLLSASAEERELNRKNLEIRDNERIPLSEEEIKILLTKGVSHSSENYSFFRILLQIEVVLMKRFYQFIRSRSQWMMGFIIPFVMAILVGLLLSTIPTDLIRANPNPQYAITSDLYPTLVAGANESSTLFNLQQAFSSQLGQSIDLIYIGENYSSLISPISSIADNGFGPTSLNGIYYENFNNFSVLYNASYPISFAADVQTLLEYAVRNVTNNLLEIVQTFNSLPSNQLSEQINSGFFIAMAISLIAGSFGAGLSIIISGERVNLIKHQQLASGMSSLAYWIGNYLFDFCVMFIYVLIFSLILMIYLPSTYSGVGYGYVVGSGFFFILAALSRFYSLSYFIADLRLAQSIYFYGSLGVVFILLNIWFTILFTVAKGNIDNYLVRLLSYLFTIVDPTFGWYTIILYRNNFLGILSSNNGDAFWSSKIAGNLLLCLFLSMIFYGFIFVFVTEKALNFYVNKLRDSSLGTFLFLRRREYQNTQKNNSTQNDLHDRNSIIPINTSNNSSNNNNNLMHHQNRHPLKRNHLRMAADQDVRNEREKVQETYHKGVIRRYDNSIFIANLTKIYYSKGRQIPSKVAVRNFNLSISKGEIFGLLGANGAGKSTLLKIVSGLELPTSGIAFINGYNVVDQTSQAQQSMGLCPQFDTLLERLSVRENLLYFGSIKGIPNHQIVEVVECFMKAMNIKRYEHKLIQQLSGGNRRKVSLIIALLGAPPTVYLDEPSTGLDPVACRLMWRLISKISQEKSSSIILTTHNMLECEAICTRVGIMKAGELVCLGDSQHLRSTHGTGFLLELTLQQEEAKSRAKLFIQQSFPQATLTEEYLTLLRYEIPKSSIPVLSKAFRLLEENKKFLQVIDYILSQSTLEQVFLKQIRPTNSNNNNETEPSSKDLEKPFLRDYLTGYIVWGLSFFFPGLHHFYLGNTWRGLKYLFTVNEIFAGWILDLLELHVLIQKSVQEKGHVVGFMYCSACHWNPCCCLCRRLFPDTLVVNRQKALARRHADDDGDDEEEDYCDHHDYIIQDGHSPPEDVGSHDRDIEAGSVEFVKH